MLLEKWVSVFTLREESEVDVVERFLSEKLLEPSRFAVDGEFLKVLLVSPSKDASFRASGWFANQNPLGRKLFYTITARDEADRVIYKSMCGFCRSGDFPHYSHAFMVKG